MLHLKSRGRAERTISTYLNALRRLDAYLADRGMPRELRAIRREHLEAWVADMLERNQAGTVSIPDEVRGYFKGYVAAFPDGRNELVKAIESSDGIVIEARFTGTNTGPMGKTPPTGKRVDWPFVVVLDMQNGKAKAHRGYGDQVALLTQLGLMPGPANG